MSQNNRLFEIEVNEWAPSKSDEGVRWPHYYCRPEKPEVSGGGLVFDSSSSAYTLPHLFVNYATNWADGVPELLSTVVALMVEKRKQEFRHHILQAQINNLQKKIQELESLQTKIIPIDSFAPEPYDLLKTIRVAVNVVENEFEAGWYDANIHSGGDNEEEAVHNLKGQIIALFNSYSSLPIEKLGPKPKRQLLVMQQFIQKAK